MFRHLFDFLMGFVVRFLVSQAPSFSSTPLIDIDGAFDRLSLIVSDTFDRLQKIMFALVTVAGISILAIGVLVVRIFQLTAGAMVSVGSLQIDGALIFGLVLAIIAGVVAKISFTNLKSGPSAEERIHAAHDALKRQTEAAQQAAAQSQTSAPSPLEDALALAIRHFVETRERNQSNASNPKGPMSEADSVAPGAPENGWNPSKMGQA